jgi:DNA-binding winged helix-turn-helix (wHTH) protein/TolB-like protein/tetratricopeptide (TPR) repeat protein
MAKETPAVPTIEELQQGFELGDWQVLPAKGLLRCADLEEKPEPKVFEVLLALARRDGDLLTRDDLIDEVWNGRPIGDEPINRCIALLRGHLGDRDRPHRYIETLTKRGYRLRQKIRLHEPAKSVGEAPRIARKISNRNRLVTVAAAIVVAVIIATVVPARGVRSIAVLPFDNLSGDPADQYLVSGIKEELVNTLQNIPDIDVINGRVAYPGREVSEIAQMLGVDAILFGALQRDGDVLKISYNVSRGRDGITISSGSVPGEIGEVFVLQAKVAVMVRDDLVGESPQQLISDSGRPNADAYDRYMRGLFELERRSRGIRENLSGAVDLFEESIEIDPGFGAAYLSLATAYALLPDYSHAPLQETHERALAVVDRGIAADSSITDAADAVRGFVYHKKRKWTKAEQAYKRATTAEVVDSNAFNWYSLMLANVGRLDDSLEQVLIGQKIDPSSGPINSRVAVVYTWINDSAQAAEFFERANRLGLSDESPVLVNAVLYIREERLNEASRLISTAVSAAGGGTDWVEPVFAALADDSERESAFAAIDAASQRGDLDPRLEISARTLLGDIDGAMQAARSLARPEKFFEFDFLFLPELRPLREHPEFLDLMHALGVKDYWGENGCVWADDRVNCPG